MKKKKRVTGAKRIIAKAKPHDGAGWWRDRVRKIFIAAGREEWQVRDVMNRVAGAKSLLEAMNSEKVGDHIVNQLFSLTPLATAYQALAHVPSQQRIVTLESRRAAATMLAPALEAFLKSEK